MQIWMSWTSLPPVLNLITRVCLHDKSRHFRCSQATTSKHPNNHQHNFSDARNEAPGTALYKTDWILLMECFILPEHTTDISWASKTPENQLCKVCSRVKEMKSTSLLVKIQVHIYMLEGEGGDMKAKTLQDFSSALFLFCLSQQHI